MGILLRTSVNLSEFKIYVNLIYYENISRVRQAPSIGMQRAKAHKVKAEMWRAG